MIVPTMSFSEIYDNIIKDRTKVNIKIEYLRAKAIKEFNKARKFPAYVIYNYKIPATNNEYVIYFHAKTRFCTNIPEANYFFSLFDNQRRNIITCSKVGHISNNQFITAKQINAYTSHFFDRYNERFLKDNSLSRNEIISRYLSRNKYATAIEINETHN